MFFGFAIAYLSVAGGDKIGTLVVALCLMRLGLGSIGFLCLKKIPSMGTILTFIIGSWD